MLSRAMRRSAFLAFAAGCAALAAPTAASARDSNAPAPDPWRATHSVAPVAATDHVYGDRNAAISVIVWSDPECPYCKMLGDLPMRAVDSHAGELNYVLRLLPLSFHGKTAVIASLATLCAGEQAGDAGVFRFFHTWLERTRSNGQGIAPDPTPGAPLPVNAVAHAAGATDDAKLLACVREKHGVADLMYQEKAADQAKVDGTPAVAVRNNRTGATLLVEGAIDNDLLESALAWARTAG